GSVRESNFGRMYTLEIKDDPDSNAYTAGALLQHMDLPTRESPHGLQFLLCRENTTTGGEGVYVDVLRIAEDLRREEPGMFDTLCSVVWEFNNRSKTSSYRACGTIFEVDATGQVGGVRFTAWLRIRTLKRQLRKQERAGAEPGP
ncbi:MAG: TauD/TfdA family dioxygenase, partial [Betaproteobacteria bacterium]